MRVEIMDETKDKRRDDKSDNIVTTCKGNEIT